MALQLSVSVRNARLDAIEVDAGVDAVLKIRTGAQPANCAAADAGTVLASLTLPTDWMAAASGGTKAKSGTWQDLSADAAGTAAHFRLYRSDGTTCVAQGSCTSVLVGTGDMLIDNVVLAAGQQFSVTAFGISDGNP